MGHYEKTLTGASHFLGSDLEFAAYMKEDYSSMSVASQEVLSDSLLAAIEQVENYLWFDINRYTVTQYGALLDGGLDFARMRPLMDKTEITVSYYDAANALQALSDGSYYLEQGIFPRIVINAPPTTYARPDAWKVVYKTGYGSRAAVPALIKSAVYRVAAYLYECRVDEKWASTSFVQQLLIGVRQYRF